ncbi:MAG TPA: hypothetical protein VHE37_11615 [Nevskiaceae bacterium]|nr:hypothetical protein [Nevskiaceae bacterium]
MKNVAVALLLACLAGAADADHDCSTGAIGGAQSKTSAPEQATPCILMGRMFCRVALMRNENVPMERAIGDSVDWFNRLKQTGSHLTRIDYRPLATGVAQYLYAHPPALGWTDYYYGVYTCGLDQRLPATGDKSAAMQRWERAAQDCEQQHPGAGDGYVNDELRACFDGAMKDIAAAR